MDLLNVLKNAFNMNAATNPEKARKAFEDVRDADYGESSRMAGHYLETSPVFRAGSAYDYPVDTLRKTKTIREGEQENHMRLLNSLTRPNVLRKKRGPLASTGYGVVEPSYSLGDIKNGEAFTLEDYYDQDIKTVDNSDADVALGLGSYKMRSKSNLQFVKFDDKILPYGDVSHQIEDVYDFEKDRGFFGTAGKTLEDSNLAVPFPVKSQWRTRPLGVIRVQDGKVDQSGVEWNFLK